MGVDRTSPRKRVKARQTPRDGRPIDWSGFDVRHLDAADRKLAGKSWEARMKQEHLAVGAFAMLVTELAEQGCEPVVLSLLARACSDEIRHAEICRKMAVCLLGEAEVPRRLRGAPSIPKHPRASPPARALMHVVEMCCLSETHTGVYLTEMLARMGKGAPREAVESLLEDEIDHGRVGWAYLASRAHDEALDALDAELPDMLERTTGWVMTQANERPETDRPALESVGYLGRSTAAAIFRRTLSDVILPGFEACGVDLGPARARIAARGWL